MPIRLLHHHHWLQDDSTENYGYSTQIRCRMARFFFPFKILRLFTNLFIAYYFSKKCFYDLVAGTRYYTIIYISLKHNCMGKNRDTLMLCVPRFLFTHFLADTKGLFSQKIFRVQQHRSSNLPSSSWHFWGLWGERIDFFCVTYYHRRKEERRSRKVRNWAVLHGCWCWWTVWSSVYTST